MSHFAQIENGIVTQVIVAEQDIIDTGIFGSNWVQTSYNTWGGIHFDPISNTPDDGIPIRANYAGIGYIYDEINDVFYPPRPYPSWTISAPNWIWIPPIPIPIPTGGRYTWDESITTWIPIIIS